MQVQSKAYVCSCSVARIASSNPAEGMDAQGSDLCDELITRLECYLSNEAAKTRVVQPGHRKNSTTTVKVNSPVTGLEWTRGFQEVKVPRLHDNGTGWW